MSVSLILAGLALAVSVVTALAATIHIQRLQAAALRASARTRRLEKQLAEAEPRTQRAPVVRLVA